MNTVTTRDGRRELGAGILADEERQVCWAEAPRERVQQTGLQNYLATGE